jgi:multidrug efflux pump subunit AcrA (membrane-fusion protein)
MLIGLSGACRKAADAVSAGADQAEEKNGQAGTVSLSPQAVVDGGIAVEAARTITLDRKIAVLGELEFNARRLAGLSARAAGRVESVSAFTGDRVSAGQILAEIYSREFLAVQTEVLQASDRARRLRGDADEAAALAFLNAARKKLTPLGLTEAEIDGLIAAGSVRPLLPVRAPFAGTIIETNTVAGGSVEPGTALFKLADLSSLWACVHIFEKDLASVRPGIEAVLKTQAFPGQEYRGRLLLVGAVMDDKTRTVEGRIELANPGGRLRPGMYIEAALPAGENRAALVVPETAVQEFQSLPVVFVRTGPAAFILRPVETGQRSAGMVEIIKGLSDGEMVVTAGSFLLKSELLKKSLGD